MKKSLGRIGSLMLLHRSLFVITIVCLASRSSWCESVAIVGNNSLASKNWRDLKGVYYRGDGRGFNQLITIQEDGQWKYRSYGCNRKPEVHVSGQGVLDSQGVVLRVTNDVVESVVQTSNTNDMAYNVIVWGERLYLAEESEIGDFIGHLNNRREPRMKMHGDHFLRIGDEKKEVWDEPSVSSQYLSLICTNELLLSIESVKNVEKVIEELDGERFCQYNIVFATTNNSKIQVGMTLASREPSGAEGRRFARVVLEENGVVEGVCGLWEGEVKWCTNWVFTTGPGFIKRPKARGESGNRGHAPERRHVAR